MKPCLIPQLHGYWIKYGAKAGRPPLALTVREINTGGLVSVSGVYHENPSC